LVCRSDAAVHQIVACIHLQLAVENHGLALL